MMNVAERTKRKRDDKKLYASITGSREKDLKVDRQIIFASCISGGAGDNSIDVVLGGSYNAYVRGHYEYHKDNFN